MVSDERTARWAASIYGVAIVMLGATSFAYRDAVLGLEPIPSGLDAARLPLSYAAAAVLVIAGTTIVAGRRVPAAALAIGVVLSVWLVLHVDALSSNIRSGNAWVCACETLALWSAAWVLVGSDGSTSPIPPSVCVASLGAACLVFGISHFVYIGYVASVIPAWLPWHRFWGYATGAAHIAAGLALLTRFRARFAAELLGVMFGSWVLVLHLPRVLRMPDRHSEWTSMLVALAMCGTSLVIASVLVPERSARRATTPASRVEAL